MPTDLAFGQRWRSSVKATHLVVAIYDYFARPRYAETQRLVEDRRQSNDSEAGSTDVQRPDPATKITGEDEVHDQWALPYIRVHNMAKLAEVIDDDMSSFVTVDEVNAFTSARPTKWR